VTEKEKSVKDIADPISTEAAAVIMEVTVRAVQNLCKKEQDELLKCRKLGRDWLVSEESARQYIKTLGGRPRKS
jgi:response regulator of citrate/malate metabolism